MKHTISFKSLGFVRFFFFFMFLKEVIYAHQGCISVIKKLKYKRKLENQQYCEIIVVYIHKF